MAADSQIGYAVGTMSDPAGKADSKIGFAVGSMRNPHDPIATWTGTVLVYHPMPTWNGTALV